MITNRQQINKARGSLTEIIKQLETGERTEFEVIGDDVPQAYPHLVNLAAKYGASVSLNTDGPSVTFCFE